MKVFGYDLPSIDTTVELFILRKGQRLPAAIALDSERRHVGPAVLRRKRDGNQYKTTLHDVDDPRVWREVNQCLSIVCKDKRESTIRLHQDGGMRYGS